MYAKTAVFEEKEEFIPDTSDLIEIKKLNRPSNQFWSYLPAFIDVGTSESEPLLIGLLIGKDKLIGNLGIYESSLNHRKHAYKVIPIQPLNEWIYCSSAEAYFEGYFSIDLDKLDYIYRDAKLSITTIEDKDEEIINFAGEILPGARGLTREEAEVIDNHILKLYKKL